MLTLINDFLFIKPIFNNDRRESPLDKTKRIWIFLKEVQIDLCVDLLNFQRACEVENLTVYLILSTNNCPL